jgi:hypothetical protein
MVGWYHRQAMITSFTIFLVNRLQIRIGHLQNHVNLQNSVSGKLKKEKDASKHTSLSVLRLIYFSPRVIGI